MKYLKTLCKYRINPSLNTKFHINHSKKNLIDLDEHLKDHKMTRKIPINKMAQSQLESKHQCNIIDLFNAQRERIKENSSEVAEFGNTD